MNVVLDIRATQSRIYGERGVARYTHGLVSALLAKHAPLAGLALDPSAPTLDPVPTSWEESGLVHSGTLPWYRSVRAPFALHLMSPFELGRPVGGSASGPGIELADRLVVTLYDLIPASMPEIYLADHSVRRAYEGRMRLLRDADLVLSISEHARTTGVELAGLDPDRVINVGASTTQRFGPDDPGDDRAVLAATVPQVQRPVVLSVTGYEPRKNTLALIDAYAALSPEVRADHQLVLVCSIPDEGRAAWLAHAEQRGLLNGEVVVTGAVSERTLAALHRAAALAVFPSLAEGFGLPVLEAASAGVPVITSSTTATPEVLECSSSVFDPRDVDEMARLIERAIADDELRATLVGAGDEAVRRHTWTRVASRTIAAYRTLEPLPAQRRPPARKVALVGPFTPAVSGVATYNERLARRLGSRCDLTVFAEHAPWTSSPRPYRLHPIDVLGDHLDPASFDARIHTLGNSLVHRRTLLDALADPDIVWLHEVDLRELHLLTARLLADRDGRDAAEGWLAERLAANDGDPGSASLVLDDEQTAPELMPPMTREVARNARRIVVNTTIAREHLERSHGVDAIVIPHAVPEPGDLQTGERQRLDPPLIASFGILAWSKRPELVLAAFSILRTRLEAALAFVGPCDERLRSQLLEVAQESGTPPGDITFTDHVTQREYGRWLSRTSVAVQLRREPNGAQSGAVADIVGAGIPLVTDMEVERSVAAAFVDPECSPDELADAIESAVDVAPAPHGGLSFHDVASRLLAVVTEVVSTS